VSDGVTESVGRARRQQALIALAGASRFMTGILMGTAMAVYVGRVGSEFAVSMVLTAYYVGVMFFAPVWGAVADVTGRRRAVMVGTGAVATVAILPLTAVSSAWGQIGLRALYAVFAIGFVPVMLTVVSARGGESGRGRSLGFFNSARAVGFTGGQVMAGVLLGLLAPSGLYLFLAGTSLLSTLAAAFVDDPTPTPERKPTVDELLAEIRRRLLPSATDREHLRTNGLRWLYVGLALRNITVMGVMALAPPFLLGSVGVTEFVMGLVLALNPASQTLFMYLFGRVADRSGRKPLVVAGMAASGVFAVVAGAATLPGTVFARAAVAVAAFVLIGAAFSAMTTGALAFIGDVAPADRQSELMGLRSTAKGVGGVVGPPIMGAIATVASIQAAFVVGSLLAFAASTLVAVGLVESRPTGDAGAAVAGND
jgi:MFS family permease